MGEGVYPRRITIRVEDGNSENGHAYDRAFLIHPNIAMIQHGEFIEFYKLAQVEGDDIYEMVVMLTPFEFRTEKELNVDLIVNDAATLSFGEFWNRYIEVLS